MHPGKPVCDISEGCLRQSRSRFSVRPRSCGPQTLRCCLVLACLERWTSPRPDLNTSSGNLSHTHSCSSNELRYLGVQVDPVRVLAGTELQARVDGTGGAGVFLIIGHIVFISISSRRQTCGCSQVCGERGRGSQTSPLYLFWLIIGCPSFIGVCLSALVMQHQQRH